MTPVTGRCRRCRRATSTRRSSSGCASSTPPSCPQSSSSWTRRSGRRGRLSSAAAGATGWTARHPGEIFPPRTEWTCQKQIWTVLANHFHFVNLLSRFVFISLSTRRPLSALLAQQSREQNRQKQMSKFKLTNYHVPGGEEYDQIKITNHARLVLRRNCLWKYFPCNTIWFQCCLRQTKVCICESWTGKISL